eukprot:6492567-Amphidinium_carterae.1
MARKCVLHGTRVLAKNRALKANSTYATPLSASQDECVPCQTTQPLLAGAQSTHRPEGALVRLRPQPH